MNIIIVGAGAIGGYLGVQLAKAGERVTFVVRPHRVAAWRDQVMVLISAENDRIQITPYIAGSVREAIAQTGVCDLLILAVKSYDLPDVIADLAIQLTSDIPMIMTTQNGIGIESRVADVFGAEHGLAATLTIPVKSENMTTWRIERDKGGVVLAPVQKGKDIRDYIELLQRAGIPTSQVQSYQSMKWSKVMFNLLSNASSAILNWTPTQVYAHEALFEMEMAMISEALAIMKAQDIKIVNFPSAPTRNLAFTVRRLPRFLRKRVLQYAVKQGRGNKMPSFNLDLVAGKRKNEVRYHNVAIARLGQQLGIPTPVNAALGDILMKLVTKRLSREQFENQPDVLLKAVAAHVEEPSVSQIGSTFQ
ncbi:MAG: ketopantoate reductase family protein [Candidatus Promineifilaceae bacterium]